MSFISEFEKLGISFKNISKVSAEKIFSTEYPYYKILEYSSLFDKYSFSDKKGQFVNLDFEQLYSLAKIDEELSNIILVEFLEIERTLKAILLSIKGKFCLPENIVEKYVISDEEYLSQVYKVESKQVLLKYPNKRLQEFTIEQFLDVIQFGTLERFYTFLYNTFLPSDEMYYVKYTSSAYKLRNIVAHYETLLSQLKKNYNYGSQDVAAYLGQQGINHKTLTTNMSKAVVFDYCNMLYLYCLIEPEYKIIQNYNKLKSFLNEYCKPYFHMFKKNATISSVYNFLGNVIEVFNKRITKK